MSSIPSPITPEYLAESHSGRILATAIPCTIIATIAVALRFTARRQVTAKIWWDDYSILFALMFLYAFNILLMVDAEIWGLGRHIPYLDELQVVKFLKALLTIQLMYFCQQAVIKTSLLLLYYRIFGSTKYYRWAIYAVGVIVLMWWLGLFFAGVFECVPVAAFWNKTIEYARCYKLIPFSLANGISNLLTDVIVLLLPIPMVWRLHTDNKQKISLTGIFLLGTFVCCISIVRITTLQDYNPVDPTWNCVDIFIWTIVESSIAIFSACLPTMRPLLGSLMRSHRTHHSKVSNSKRTGDSVTDSTRAVWGKATPEINSKGGFTRLDEESAMSHLRGESNGGGVRSWVTSEERDPDVDVDSYPMAIMQQHAMSQREDRPPKMPLQTPSRAATRL